MTWNKAVSTVIEKLPLPRAEEGLERGKGARRGTTHFSLRVPLQDTKLVVWTIETATRKMARKQSKQRLLCTISPWTGTRKLKKMETWVREPMVSSIRRKIDWLTSLLQWRYFAHFSPRITTFLTIHKENSPWNWWWRNSKYYIAWSVNSSSIEAP